MSAGWLGGVLMITFGAMIAGVRAVVCWTGVWRWFALWSLVPMLVNLSVIITGITLTTAVPSLWASELAVTGTLSLGIFRVVAHCRILRPA